MLFVAATMGEIQKSPINKEELSKLFLAQIINKRIEVMKLPIKFTDHALVAVSAFCDRPGYAVALLVDCLNKYEGQTVDCGMLADLYPMGFYDEPSLMKYVDDYLKPRKVKWAEIY